ncbi:MAG: peptide deformylase [Cyanobacteria bacterium SW_9_44_58]|nr:MAG: peptide deformylase [Cyanobacteria bacterium SW_9_44_58]
MTTSILNKQQQAEQAPLSLHYLGDRTLRQSTKRINKINQSVRDLAKDMLQTMYTEQGIGLAAPQVGVNKQMLVVDCDPGNTATPPLILINPQIQSYSKELAKGEEGCLSIPGVFLDVVRPEAIEVKYKDESGRPKKMEASGLLAKVIQHEFDHLHGILFVDRVPNDLVLTEALHQQGFSTKAVQPVKSKQ